ncbi:uncharacterized protein N7511_008091 [Penicillium nucicola]|uniref:uncharacterized protein n=1 Tax=Penicillium nucicola TaxID=1850975 RepID=UPI002545534B|nr:uncharacterized protein N7511_008091 [Penicillium nucicola]KAJ5753938.1 hypothetical protein N7511_008091 [Penicillium nucicola]
MPDPQVSVTFTPFWDDSHPCRTLNLFDDDEPVLIGRASKREARKRAPADDNGWFDSRVMSRDHALLSISVDVKNVYIVDCGSTHGTFLNDDKLVAHVETPLLNGDILRFGVDVDRGQEVFEALEVRCCINWSPPPVMVENSDAITIKPQVTASTNTFSVPEDYSDVDEPEDAMIDSDDSKNSIAQIWDSVNPQNEQVSPVSSVSERPKEVTEPVKFDIPEASPSQADQSTKSISPADISDTVENITREQAATIAYSMERTEEPVKLHQEIAEQDEEAIGFHNTKMETFPPSCYQKLVESEFSDWSMMKPLFMRLADMAWGVSDKIPDVDHVNKIIHSARRCSIAKSSYMVDDSSDFQPWNGTEMPWEFNADEESDTTYHRVPGPALRYWFVDKRRFWILDGDEENDLRMSDWWWIVEKPWELLSEATKAELRTEGDVDDCHKYWIVREWEPQMIGGQYYEKAPYWDSNFCEDLPSDDESLDSDEVGDEGDLNIGTRDGDESVSDPSDGFDASSDSKASQEGDINEFSSPLATFFAQELYDEDDEDDSEYDSGDSNDESSSEDDGSEDQGSASEYDDENQLSAANEWDEGESESDSEDEVQSDTCPEEAYINRLTRFIDVASFMPSFYQGNNHPGASLPTPTSACSVRPAATTVNDTEATDQPLGYPPASSDMPDLSCMDEDQPETGTLITSASPAMIDPAARFPICAVSDELPTSCQGTLSQVQLDPFMERPTCGPSINYSPYPLLAPWHPASKEAMSYDDGPFCSPQKNLKRNATQMESTPNDMECFSQDAQCPNLLASYSQGTDLNTIASAEVQDAIASALSENEPPAKRVKSTHSAPSRSLASHAATAVVGALLGGLGTIAMLAALPPDYFH